MKLTLDALKERADAVASEELLLTISGGTENACHDEGPTVGEILAQKAIDDAETYRSIGDRLIDWWNN